MLGKLTVSMILFSPPEGGELAGRVVGVKGVVSGVNRGDLKMGDVMGELSTPIILGSG